MGLVSSHVLSSQKLHPLKQHRSSVDMEFFQWKWEHGVHTVHTPFFEYGVCLSGSLYFLGSEDERKATQAGTGESGKHASKSGNSLKTELP